MRIATFDVQGRRRVGAVSEDGRSITPFVLDEAEARRGALTLIERHPAGDGAPQLSGERFALVDVQLEAPLPLPRRNLFCIGRNYHAHARELSGSVFKSAPTEDPELADRLHQGRPSASSGRTTRSACRARKSRARSTTRPSSRS